METRGVGPYSPERVLGTGILGMDRVGALCQEAAILGTLGRSAREELLREVLKLAWPS